MAGNRREFLKKASVSAASLTAIYWGLTEANYYITVQNDDICTPAGNASIDIDEIKKTRERLSSSATMGEEDFYDTGLGQDQRQFLLFGDTDHSDPRHTYYFFSKDHLDRLSEAGVKHIFIEQSKDHQQYYDDLTAGKLSPEEFAAVWASSMWHGDNLYEDMLMKAYSTLYAAKKGIKIHCADIENNEAASKDDNDVLYDFVKDMTGEFQRVCGNDNRLTNSFANAYGLKSPLRTILSNRAIERVMIDRHNDTRRARYIKSIAGGERSALFYGAAHMADRDKSFKTLFGVENCVHINLVPGIEKIYEKPRNLEADFAHVIDRKAVYQTGAIAFEELKPAAAQNTPVAARPQYNRRDFFQRFLG